MYITFWRKAIHGSVLVFYLQALFHSTTTYFSFIYFCLRIDRYIFSYSIVVKLAKFIAFVLMCMIVLKYLINGHSFYYIYTWFFSFRFSFFFCFCSPFLLLPLCECSWIVLVSWQILWLAQSLKLHTIDVIYVTRDLSVFNLHKKHQPIHTHYTHREEEWKK